VLFVVFPDNEFAEYLDLFNDAINHPNSLKPFISELQKQLNTGAFSHTTGAMYHFLAMDNHFDVFTRDYVRRCCDMVEYIIKRKVAFRFNLEYQLDKQPLGSVITVFMKNFSRQFPDGLLEALSQFNMAIYRPAKHDSVSKEEERMFSVADAIAITFMAVKLCQRLDDFQRKYPFC
jgi:hypothetical protein